MTATLLDGKTVANGIKKTLAAQVASRTQQGYPQPGLAVVLLGDDPASMIYVKNKRKACEETGFRSFAYDLPATTSENDLLSLIERLNNDRAVHGILVQLPLPTHINTARIIESIHPSKDVDGFHPYNFGRLAQGNPLRRPCTPYGIMTLLDYYQLNVSGINAVVIGKSNIVGRPMALELLLADATVTVCHRATRHLEPHVRTADLIIVATGCYDVVKPDWLNKKQIVVDIGMHRDSAGNVHGDMNFEEAYKRVGWITPVPGGVGPMTISMLLQNTMGAAVEQTQSSI